MNNEELIQLFEEAIKSENSDEIEVVLTFSFSNSNFKDFEKYFLELLGHDWHFNHEDIARLLQQFGSTHSVDEIFKATTKKFQYLDYDDSKAFARKCTWALADIGSCEAKEALVKLSKNEDAEIADYAKKRVENWDNEKSRKRYFN